jgi:hypothetical protein
MQSGDYFPITAVGSGMIVASSTWGSTLDLDLSKNKDFAEVTERLAEIEKRLAILRPNEELQARFPALQEAYDNYKLIEKLVNDKRE